MWYHYAILTQAILYIHWQYYIYTGYIIYWQCLVKLGVRRDIRQILDRSCLAWEGGNAGAKMNKIPFAIPEA